MKPKHILAAVLIIFVTSCASSIPQPSQQELASARPYPLNTCLVIDRPLSETKKTYTKIYKGQQVKFCCTNCIIAFDANPDIFMKKIK